MLLDNDHMIRWSLVAIMLLTFISCEKEFTPDILVDPEEIVVEGYIEAGDIALPPYVLLTRSIPFFSTISAEQLSSLFVHDAIVKISDGTDTIELEEVCWDDFDEQFQELLVQILEQLGIVQGELPPVNFCVYLDTQLAMLGEIGKTYSLSVDTGEEQLEAVTSIPTHVPLDSLFFVEPAGQVPDSLKELRVIINDPVGQADYYRYFTSINFSPFLAPMQSVADDQFFDGQTFEFPLAKADPPSEDGIPDEYFGLYTVGDTLLLRWCNLDEAHHDFWNTLEFNAINQGPFSSYTIVDSNVEGGLGVWGGYSVSYYTMIVE